MLRSFTGRRLSAARSVADRLFRPLAAASAAADGGAMPLSQSGATPVGQIPAAFSLGTVRAFYGSTVAPTVYDVGHSTNIKWHEAKVSKDERQRLLGQRGCVIWMTGLSGSGKSTLAYTLEHALMERGRITVVLDGDNVRHGLNKNLGFSAADREENIRRVGEVSKLFADAGIITIVSFISPYTKDRQAARSLVEGGEFIEVYMKIPLSVCEERDPKGLYKKARSGQLKGFTGIDDPYEEPEAPEVVIEVAKEDGVLQPPEKMAADLIEYLDKKGILSGPK